MSTLVKKLLGRNIQNIIVIMLAIGIYFLATALQIPVLAQLVVIAAVLLSLLRVNDEQH